MNNVAACAKHCVGDGGTTKGINENNTVIDRHGLLGIHMPGCYSSIIKGVSTLTASYSSLNGLKMHANHEMVTNFLKKTFRFRASNILVTGSHAHNLCYQCSGWTIKWQGPSGNNLTSGTTILSAINTVDPSTKVAYNENPDPEAKHNHNVRGTVKCVVIIISGRPGVIQPYLASMEALAAAWLPGSEGQGMGITSKLSFTCSRPLISCQCMLEIHIMIPLSIKVWPDHQTK
ncbi:hypothetical protein V6N11_080079 [Hibiscus sabdariffa]|uniref:Uncharacterized protein n=1 Tax=Hibiscus sabdariffa TaxID=183260 RepID=A0ABR2RY41_9ROSI